MFICLFKETKLKPNKKINNECVVVCIKYIHITPNTCESFSICVGIHCS